MDALPFKTNVAPSPQFTYLFLPLQDTLLCHLNIRVNFHFHTYPFYADSMLSALLLVMEISKVGP